MEDLYKKVSGLIHLQDEPEKLGMDVKFFLTEKFIFLNQESLFSSIPVSIKPSPGMKIAAYAFSRDTRGKEAKKEAERKNIFVEMEWNHFVQICKMHFEENRNILNNSLNHFIFSGFVISVQKHNNEWLISHGTCTADMDFFKGRRIFLLIPNPAT